MEMAVHLAVAGDVFGGVIFCAVLFPQEMSWMRSGTELSQFPRIFLTYSSIYTSETGLLKATLNIGQ